MRADRSSLATTRTACLVAQDVERCCQVGAFARWHGPELTDTSKAGYASIDCMSAITVRNLDEHTLARLRVKAAAAGQSLEAYLRGELDRLSRRPGPAEMAALAARNEAVTPVTADEFAQLDAQRRRRLETFVAELRSV